MRTEVLNRLEMPWLEVIRCKEDPPHGSDIGGRFHWFETPEKSLWGRSTTCSGTAAYQNFGTIQLTSLVGTEAEVVRDMQEQSRK
jgi:hypothetical protein